VKVCLGLAYLTDAGLRPRLRVAHLLWSGTRGGNLGLPLRDYAARLRDLVLFGNYGCAVDSRICASAIASASRASYSERETTPDSSIPGNGFGLVRRGCRSPRPVVLCVALLPTLPLRRQPRRWPRRVQPPPGEAD